MIKSLTVRNFTVFTQGELTLGRHLNVFIGENGTGKSHLLKLIYTLLWVSAHGQRESKDATPGEAYLKGAIARKLLGVFRPDELGRLAQRRTGVQRCDVALHFERGALDIAFSFNTKDKLEVALTTTPTAWAEKAPVFLPTRELLTIYPGFVSLYETTSLPFEETWRDVCVLLGAPLLRGPRDQDVKNALDPLEESLGGKISLEPSGFYLSRGGANTEMHLVAEGLRKLAMVARLVATGSLLDKGFLFWDEPEANLNPRLIKEVAKTIVHLSRNGIQVFIATHSLFLMRELYILQASNSPLDTRSFGLTLQGDGLVEIEQGSTIDDLSAIAALEEELEQTDRYLATEEKLGATP